MLHLHFKWFLELLILINQARNFDNSILEVHLSVWQLLAWSSGGAAANEGSKDKATTYTIRCVLEKMQMIH